VKFALLLLNVSIVCTADAFYHT